MNNEEHFPPHIVHYVLHEYMKRLKAYVLQQHRIREASPSGCQVVDELTLAKLLKTPVAIEGKAFILIGEVPEDTETFRVIGSVRSNREAFWEILYDGAEDPVRMDEARTMELLLGSIAYDDPLDGDQVH